LPGIIDSKFESAATIVILIVMRSETSK